MTQRIGSASRVATYIGKFRRRKIAKYLQSMKKRPVQTSAIVIMIYKMNLEPVRYRKSSLEVYGERRFT